MPWVRLRRTAHSRRDVVAKSSPSSSRCQCLALRIVGAEGDGSAVGASYVAVSGMEAQARSGSQDVELFFFRPATPAGGLGVTSARHVERGAKTP